MKSLAKKLSGILQRGGFAFLRYPASMLAAFCLAGLSIWMIYAEPSDNLKLFSSLQWAFALCAPVGMALCVIAKKTGGKPASVVSANVGALLIGAGAFFAVYYAPGGSISGDSAIRIFAGMAVSFLIFLYVPTIRTRKIYYNQMVFMTLKSFFIAAVYALVIMLGSFFVAFAVQSLLYSDMSEKVYAYLAIAAGFLGYAFFLGYFPEFVKEEPEEDERTDKAIRQPRFAEILFQNIMIPIVGALTVVLLIWAVRILVTWDWPDYTQLVAIFTTYSMAGIFLYFLVSSYDVLPARLYRRIFPIAALLFLAFEAYPVADRILRYGVKPGEYAVAFLWLFAVATNALFLFLPIIKNRVPTYLAVVLITVSVLPVIGAPDLSFTLQEKRLESLLVKNGMLSDGIVTPGSDLEAKDRQDITDATQYLFVQENRTAPDWILNVMPDLSKFSQAYGFQEAYYNDGQENPGVETAYLYLTPEYAPIPIDEFQYAIPAGTLLNGGDIALQGKKGAYTLRYSNDSSGDAAGTPAKITDAGGRLQVRKGDTILLDAAFDDFFAALHTKYPVGSSDSMKGERKVPAGELTFEISGDGVSLRVVFQGVTLIRDSDGKLGANYDLGGVYFKETD